MTAKQQAVEDIKNDLLQQSKSFLMFNRRLDPVMRKLVSRHKEAQRKVIDPFYTLNKKPSQLVARCLFCKETGNVTYTNYQKYYNEKHG